MKNTPEGTAMLPLDLEEKEMSDSDISEVQPGSTGYHDEEAVRVLKAGPRSHSKSSREWRPVPKAARTIHRVAGRGDADSSRPLPEG